VFIYARYKINDIIVRVIWYKMDIYEETSVTKFIQRDDIFGKDLNGWRYLPDNQDSLLSMLICRKLRTMPAYLFDVGCGYNSLSFQIANCCDGNYKQITLVDPRFKNKPLHENMGDAVYPTNVKRIKTITRPLPGAVYSIIVPT
jgi:hypothetical protein